jgi:hypothetical protein
VNEDRFVRDIKQSLDEGLDQIDTGIRTQLYIARRQALTDRRSPSGNLGILTLAGKHPWLIATLLASGLLLAAWSGLHSTPTSEDAQVDIMLLTGNIPPQAYADWRLVRREDVGEQCRHVR